MNNLERTLHTIRNEIPKKYAPSDEIETFDTYDFKPGLWIPKISVDKNNTLLVNSNHFIELITTSNDVAQENGEYARKRKPHYIYSRIVNNYLTIVNPNKTKEIVVIHDKCIYLHNSFSSGNAGHDLFCMLNVIMKYGNDSEIKFILFDEVGVNYNNYNILKMFVTDERIIKINQQFVYNFKRQIIEKEIAMQYVQNYYPIIQNVLSKLKLQHETLLSDQIKNDLKNRNAIIIKNNSQENIVRPEDCFNATLLFDFLKANDWIIINPEKMDFYEMTYILMNANTIITGQYGISCCNQIFYNLNATIIGFIVNTNNDTLYFDSQIPYDAMCNAYYYNHMKEMIVSPLNITQKNVEEFKIKKKLNQWIFKMVK